jgi:large subunit ribosomal protein L15
VEGRIDRISAAPTRREDIGELIGIFSRRMVLIDRQVFYSNHKNRGFISPSTLEALQGMPFVEERWKLLSTELGGWKRQKSLVENNH